ncbi:MULTISPECIES: phosphatase PAP2 family protein [unclassified Micromonospora]|uniref:phosphatase PAP2 family protein n=1 Tax=unclassified Micromonospora TaxID=2617518 RepID=UPI001B35ED86|nr:MULTISPECIES: phosphatase PAP2 family protein [unclassified Micromonospora]MBQ1042861.1 phosphatase PAP2 family protein [Micromonospora sp. C72]MBQ1057934.1 phosphatase PAP2 family protein [Micromonospora sp. C32]
MDTTGATVTRRRSWRGRRLDPEHSLGLRLSVATAAAFLVLIPFALLALLVLGAWPPLLRLDASITDAFHGYAQDHPAWVGVMTVWTHLFGPGPLRVAAAVVAVWLFRRGASRLAAWVVVTMIAGGLLGALLKLLVGRDRPDLLEPVARAAGYSFPSGHALNAALAAGVLLLVFLPYARDSRAGRITLWAAALLVTVVTGLSRIALGVHWTSDVVGGWVLGTAVVAATSAGFVTWRTGTGRPSTRPLREGAEPDLAEPGAPDGRA